MDKKGIFTFLAVTLGLSVAVQAVAIATQAWWVTYFVLIVPVLGAFIARRVSPDHDEVDSRIWPVPKLPAVRVAIVTPAVLATICIVTALCGLARPDWNLGELMVRISSQGNEQAAKALAMPNMAAVMLVLGILFSLLLGPTIVAATMIGIEYGWRGYLLPRMMPLGKWRACAALGLMWGLSMAPTHIVNTAHPPTALLVLSLAMYVVVSGILGEIWIRTRNIGLTAIFYGCFSTLELVESLFPDSRVVFPWGGTGGVVAIIAWGLVALFPVFFFGRLGQPAQTKALSSEAQSSSV